jgi:EAL domain-containing protein (putative c-di-GMP-specific phosphodiesterase class I)
LFRKLNWPIVAEGVETDEHMTYLQELGLEYFQGYKIGYPEKGDKLLEQLKKQF